MLPYDPEFIVFTGPMFGSKTTKLIAAVERLHYRSLPILVFKPKQDTRSRKTKVESHSGVSINATPIASGEEILALCTDASLAAVAVDEAFMIPGVANALVTLFKSGKTVIVSSIQLSALGEPLHEIKEVLPWATRVEVCPAVCPVTGRDAFYTQRKTWSDKTLEVGGSDIYEPRCWGESSLFSTK